MLAVVALAALTPGQTLEASTVITFEDLLAPTNSSNIPRPYHGLIFSGSPYLGVLSNDSASAPIGVQHGAVSGKNVLLSDVQSMGITAFGAELGAVFTLQSVYFTSAVETSMQVHAQGFTRTGPTLDTFFTLTNAGPTLIPFNWQNVSSVEFTGVHPVDVIYFDSRFVIDDLTVDTAAPEAGTVLLLAPGLVLLLVGTVRRRSNASAVNPR